MCGIAGFVDYNFSSCINILESMTDALMRRGPDFGGYEFFSCGEAQIGLGHRRLSVMDLTNFGNQPMKFNDLYIVYNGEVYNFVQIRTELEAYGYTFISNTDTEVILKAFDLWGYDALKKFNGMFAFCIYDMANLKITIARDRAGIKPIYWYESNGLFMFASEIKSFHMHSGFNKEIDNNALAKFLERGYIPHPYSIYRNVEKINPGTIVQLDLKTKRKSLSKYWDLSHYYSADKIHIPYNEAEEHVTKLLESSCAYRMISDVPVGMFLSGGYDSTAVAAIIQKNVMQPLKTFTIGFEDSRFDESQHAKNVSMYLGTDHTEHICSSQDALDIIPQLPLIWDEPFADPSAIPTALLSMVTRRDVTVSLSSDGGDEIFGGYEKYTHVINYYEKLHQNVIAKVFSGSFSKFNFGLLSEYSKNSNLINKLEKILRICNSKNELLAMESIQSVFTYNEIGRLLNNIDDYGSIHFNCNDDYTCYNIKSIIDRLMLHDYKSYQQDDILVKVDRATMYFGLEGREPLLDYRLAEFMAQLDPTYKIHNGTKKYILKNIVHRYVPENIMRRPKMGFGAPLSSWFKGRLKHFIEYYLSEECLRWHNLFDVKMVERIRNDYLRGSDYRFERIWVLLVFQLWYEKWVINTQ